MPSIQDITNLMLREGEFRGQQKSEAVAQQELDRIEFQKAQHPIARNYLKYFALIAPWLIPGGGVVASLARVGVAAAASRAAAAADPDDSGATSSAADTLAQFANQYYGRSKTTQTPTLKPPTQLGWGQWSDDPR